MREIIAILVTIIQHKCHLSIITNFVWDLYSSRLLISTSSKDKAGIFADEDQQCWR